MLLDTASYIDHTLLLPEATPTQIIKLCEVAERYGFATVCVNPSYVKLAAQHLRAGTVGICTVIGFPLGATTSETKMNEVVRALLQGASELDLVMHIGRLKSGDHAYVEREILLIADLVHKSNALLKVIIETGVLTDEEKVIACRLSERAGADFIKTSTGFRGGATIADVRLIRANIGVDMGLKASGGIGSYAEARALITAGATRIGTSSGVAIMAGAPCAKNISAL